jgi:hypothetical protein
MVMELIDIFLWSRREELNPPSIWNYYPGLVPYLNLSLGLPNAHPSSTEPNPEGTVKGGLRGCVSGNTFLTIKGWVFVGSFGNNDATTRGGKGEERTHDIHSGALYSK